MMNQGIDQGVAQRVDAYRGNPQALQQKYAVSQELVDLLALQKIKSEKEAAARQMQLQMGQQQAANGEPPTVAEQREKEVMDMTKQEMVQQQAGLMQQKQQEQQQGMQKLAQGIASAPGAQMAAQPQMMAAGGIVAFAGPDGSQVKGKSVDPAYEAILQSIYRHYPKLSDEQKRAMADKQLAQRNQALADANNAADPEAALVEGAKADLPPGTVPNAGSEFPPTGAGAGRGEGGNPGFPPEGPGAPKPQPPAAPDTSALKAQIDGAIQQQPQGPAQAALAPSTRPAYQDAPQAAGVAGLLGKDPDAMARAGRKEGLDFLTTPGRKEAVDAQQQGLAALDAQQLDPEQIRKQKLQNFLLGAGGQGSIGRALGAGGRSAVNFERNRADEQRRRLLQRNKMVRDEFDIDEKNRKGAFEAGEGRFKEGAADRRQGIASGVSMRNTDQTTAASVRNTNVNAQVSLRNADQQMQTAGLDRDSRERISEMQAQVQQETSAALRANATQAERNRAYGNAETRLLRAEKQASASFDRQINQIRDLQGLGQKLDPEQQTRLDQLIEDRARAVRAAVAPIEAEMNRLAGADGASSAADKALVDKHKGK